MVHNCQMCSERVDRVEHHRCYTMIADARPVLVAEFRRHITHLERLVTSDWSSCTGGLREQVACTDRMRRVGGELIGMVCRGATADDMARRERALDRSTTLITRVEG